MGLTLGGVRFDVREVREGKKALNEQNLDFKIDQNWGKSSQPSVKTQREERQESTSEHTKWE